MKSKIAVLLFTLSYLLMLLKINAEDMPVEFRGYAKFDGEQFFSLKCTQGRGSAWVHIGQGFYEGRLVEYDPIGQCILFANKERIFKIKLFQSQESQNLTSYKESKQFDSKKAIRKRAPTGGVPLM